jgi:hypothetical protein
MARADANPIHFASIVTSTFTTSGILRTMGKDLIQPTPVARQLEWRHSFGANAMDKRQAEMQSDSHGLGEAETTAVETIVTAIGTKNGRLPIFDIQ